MSNLVPKELHGRFIAAVHRKGIMAEAAVPRCSRRNKLKIKLFSLFPTVTDQPARGALRMQRPRWARAMM
jgi:hypothetical protein